MAKPTNLTEDELKALQENVSKLNEVHMELGVLENQKHKILHEMNEIEKEFNDLQKQLENTYGKVSINMDNGELSEIPQKDE
jgi:vacuolar-type H+-ATPase subunit D/Vma8